MNILFFCNRSSRFGVLGSGFSVRGSRSSKMVRDCLWIASGPVRLRVDYVSITCRLRVVYVFDPYQAGKNGCVHRAIPEKTSKKSRTILGVVKSNARFTCLCTREIMYDLRQIWENGAKNGLMDLLIRAKCLLFRICPCTCKKKVILLHPILNTRI
jgi:hypothetical protein